MATARPRTLAPQMQPSEDEIQREVENLRDIRRRSTAQGPVIDPDLPSQTAQAAAAAYWHKDDSSSDSHSHEDVPEPQTPGDDPFHLFWVPARMHPEIDPAEFRHFLKEHARAPADGSPSLERTSSMGSSALGRKRSMLSRQYQPSDDSSDDGSEERVLPLRRNRSSMLYSPGPQLTIKDLEKLDELAEEASQSSDPSRLRSVLRRSLSMNVSPSAIDKMDNVPDMGDEADAPIIVPRPGQILRRAARTKIRKPGQTGEGAHRFNATRRGSAATRAASVDDTTISSVSARTSSEQSSSASDHGDVPERRPRPRVTSVSSTGSASDEPPRLVRPDSYSAETFIYDAYANDDDDDRGAIVVSPISSPPPPPHESLAPALEPEREREEELATPVPASTPMPSATASGALPAFDFEQPFAPAASPAPSPHIAQPVPQRAQTLGSGAILEPYRVASPDSVVSAPLPQTSSVHEFTPTPAPALQQPHGRTISPAPTHMSLPESRKDKDKDAKKGGLFKWGGSDKKGKKEKEKEREKEKEKEKDSFFGALFGSKKKADEGGNGGLGGAGAGREAAAALLGASKSARGLTPSPGPGGAPLPNNYARYPIHVERAIYRLSHIKLANPRRPLYEQVLISNLMFWYLGVINKAQTQAQQAQQQQQQQGQQQQHPQEAAQAGVQQQQQQQQPLGQGQGQPNGAAPPPQMQAAASAAQAAAEREAEERERAEAEREQAEQQRRRGGLTKSGATSPRRAEQPVRGPQYDAQSRAMEHERQYAAPAYGGQFAYEVPPQAGVAANGRPPLARDGSQQKQQQQWPEQQHQQRQALVSRGQQQQHPQQQQPRQQVSPPRGASPQQQVPPPRGASPPPHQRRSRSPPPHNRYGGAGAEKAGAGARTPTRSVSAGAPVPAGVPNGRGPGRKAISAHAQPAPHPRTRTSEDEDVPLAMWQQQQAARRR